MLHVPSRNFIVVAHPRTGTNFLCHLIANRGDVKYMGEFYPEDKEGNVLHELFDGNPNMHLRWPYNLPEDECTGRFAKLFYYLFVRPDEQNRKIARWDLFDYMKRDNIRMIHLKRKNILDTALSNILSKKERNYVFQSYKEPIHIDKDVMAHNLWLVKWQTDAMDEALKEAGMSHLELWYDRITEHPQETANKVADFLQRPRKEAVVAKMTKKQRQGSQRDNILNYDELKEYFSHWEYAEYFED